MSPIMPIATMEKTEMPTAQNLPAWRHVCSLSDIPVLGARVVNSERGDVAVFRNAEDEIFALRDKCPHKGGPLSQGIVFGRSVACPLHGWNITLEDGHAVAPDKGCTASFQVRVEEGQVYILL
jgi:nitrite reductase (NADH) small subunit